MICYPTNFIFLLFILFFHQIDKKNACFISKINKICIFAIYNKRIMIKLLLVEDDASLRYIVQGGLEDMIGGYEVIAAANGEEGLKQWKEQHPDVIVSDIEMPVMNGYEMVKRIRETDGETPILFSSALISPKDVVKGYEIGANNYIKNALLKLSKGEKSKDTSQCYKIGKEYVLDATHATLKHASGVNKTLTVRETGLLQMLCEKRGDVIRREAILDKFWNTEDDYFASRSLDVFVTRLRKFLSEDESVTIKTVKGVGLILIEN